MNTPSPGQLRVYQLQLPGIDDRNWWLLHDPSVYVSPEKFDPQRYLPPCNELDSADASGYGRVIFRGRLFADTSLYLNIVQFLATFNISKAVDGQGKPIDIAVVPKPGILSYLTPFQFFVAPRNDKAIQLLEEMRARRPKDASNSDDAQLILDSGDIIA
ncbi:hypothetical protein SEUCBS140593_003710 [Sporothrix eucalyptigena]|uniref:Uncharacterized protein n=1 Tax=Sporothrix eucalyptigena TaxID=1812306 RepID=A0ABP0BH35_9PEZI